jgi:hypothetical protein
MTKPDKNLLRRLMGLAATTQQPAECDPADMGTAFGLEYSLDQAPLAPLPTLRSAKRAASTATTASPIQPPAAGKGWLRRRGH